MVDALAGARPSAEQLADLELMAHLYRRAGFGATRDELEVALRKGYEAVVDELLHPEQMPEFDEEMLFRYCPDTDLLVGGSVGQQIRWVFRMVYTQRPLEEKMTLFWHGLFATSYTKAFIQVVGAQIDHFRRNCLADFRTILLELSRDPAMIFWLDNQENTKAVHNENYGRELLELFSMGIGTYTEDDVKNCARAFTGWTVETTLRVGPCGERPWKFAFRPELHDFSEKTFLGEHGNFDGTDIIDIIVRQPACARFIARRLHNFFVSDEPDEAAIDRLAAVFAQTQGDIRAVLRELFLSDFFRSRSALYARVKSPAEHVVGILRLVGGFDRPELGVAELGRAPGYMGQDLLNPPSVEGWHTGKEWIDSGLLIERVNFSVAQLGELWRPGIRRIIDRLRALGELEPERLVDACLDLIGPLPASDTTRDALVEFATRGGPLRWDQSTTATSEKRVARVLQLISASREFQFT